MPRTEQLNIRITPSEKEALVAEATRSNLKVSDYVRKRLLGPPLRTPTNFCSKGWPHLALSYARL